MKSSFHLLLCALVGALAQAPPPPVLLTTAQSGVDPIIPTPFPGVETEEGAIIFDGPPVPGFTGPGGNATVQSGLSAATYQAVLPSTNFDPLTGSTITGTITGKSLAGGQGVMFSINFTGFPDAATYGPFVYHVHNLAVPADGNCSSTLGHLDPTNRGELYACDNTAPQSCQAGDLAGKHGNITGASYVASYTDLYLSTTPGSPYFFGDKSVVIHTSNTTRLTCANFVLQSGGSAGVNGTGSGTPTSSGGGSGGGSPTGSSPGSTTSIEQSNEGATGTIGKTGFVGGALAMLVAYLL